MSTEISNAVIERYEREGVVCPAKLRNEIFTTAAVDNIDHNPSSTTSQGSFHGTAISLVQHPLPGNTGKPRYEDVISSTNSSNSRKISQLPSSFSEVPPLSQRTTELYAPAVQQLPESDDPIDSNHEYKEEDWLINAEAIFKKKGVSAGNFVS